ncbi:MAG: hypothetical protein GY756_15570, partial [bacterium]|nr:hypothetical protein [bacterium]
LAFRFNPHPEVKNDPSGLAYVKTREKPNESELAIGIINQVKSWIDLDNLVFRDIGLYDQLLLDSKQLLKEARYSLK